MGSIIPFQDLNLQPNGAVKDNTPGAGAASTLLVPKVEKFEPWDEPLQTHQPLQLQEPSQPFFCQMGSFPFPPSTHLNAHLAEQSYSPAQAPGEEDVYSQYCKITELFRAAFANGSRPAKDGGNLGPNLLAIVPICQEDRTYLEASPYENPGSSEGAVSKKRSCSQRSSELVRVTDLGIEEKRRYRDIMRRTRMVYDSLRIISTMKEGRRLGLVFNKRARGDLMAAAAMKARNTWLNRDKRIVGTIPGIDVGDLFFFRVELMVCGVHGHIQAGIDYLSGSQSSNGEPVATSVIVSGGYEDDEDGGDVIIYTGHGGQDKYCRQVAHQKLEGGNLALERSMHFGIEVRVIRGLKYEGSLTSKVYVYDGLYKVVDCWFDVGKSGFGVFKFKLVRIDGQPEMGSLILRLAENIRKGPLAARPSGYCSLDISNKKENVPVLLFNDIDSAQEPLYYDYLTKTAFPPIALQSRTATGCDCVAGCNDDCLCAMKNGGSLAYDQNGNLFRGRPVIFECGPSCGCPQTCRNRVTQNGLTKRLEVFRSQQTGWGVRSLDLIHSGSFICEYTGVVLTREQAQILTMNGDVLIYPQQFSERWKEWGNISQVYPEFVHPSYPLIPPLDFAMDVSKMRNVACYISHSSTPNVFVQCVLYDHNNLMFPHLMIFAMENIPAMRELSLDYGVADEVMGKLSICN